MGSLGQANIGVGRGIPGSVGTASTSTNTNAAAPHAETVRVSFTCPSNVDAQVESVSMEAIRITAAAPVGLWQVCARYTPSGGSLARIGTASSMTNVIGDRATAFLASGWILSAGDLIEITTQDNGTGGTISYFNGIKVRSYNV